MGSLVGLRKDLPEFLRSHHGPWALAARTTHKLYKDSSQSHLPEHPYGSSSSLGSGTLFIIMMSLAAGLTIMLSLRSVRKLIRRKPADLFKVTLLATEENA